MHGILYEIYDCENSRGKWMMNGCWHILGVHAEYLIVLRLFVCQTIPAHNWNYVPFGIILAAQEQQQLCFTFPSQSSLQVFGSAQRRVALLEPRTRRTIRIPRWRSQLWRWAHADGNSIHTNPQSVKNQVLPWCFSFHSCSEPKFLITHGKRLVAVKIHSRGAVFGVIN